MDYHLENLPELLKSYLGTENFIKNTKITRLTPPGENYGSIMLKLDVTLGNKRNDSEEIINGVAKILPDTEVFRKIFHIQTTYSNEMAFYEIIVPTLRNFQKELGVREVIESFPKCIATRKNLTGGDNIDEGAVLILENLIELGYKNIDRVEGFDFATTKMILRDLAQLHALPLALKIRKPEIFEQKIKSHCDDFDPKYLTGFEELVRNIVKQNEEIAQHAHKVTHWGQIERSKPREPFATLIHADLWTNNTMQKFKDGQPVSNKFVDFQLITYGSPAADVFFFLSSSVPQEVLEPHLEFLLEFYYKHLINDLKELEIDVSPFSYDSFLAEMAMECEYELGHGLVFYVNSVTKKNADPDYEEFSGQYVLNHATQRTKEKVWYLVKECIRRGWIE